MNFFEDISTRLRILSGSFTRIKCNGYSILTSKSVKRIDGNGVYFDDGSYIDTDARVARLVGSGDILISPAIEMHALPEEPLAVRRWHFGDMSNVYVSDIPGCDLNIKVHDKDSIFVEVTATSKFFDYVTIREKNGEVVVSSSTEVTALSEHSDIQFVKTGRGDFWTSGPLPTQITMSVPRGCNIVLEGRWASAVIGDTHGEVYVESKGSGDCTIGEVSKATLLACSMGSIETASVNGLLTAVCKGSGDITLKSGSVTKATLVVFSEGSIRCGADVSESVEASTSGSGDIRISSSVKNRADVYVKSMGSVHIASLNGSGRFNAEGSGDISVKDGCIASCSATVTSMGSIKLPFLEGAAYLNSFGSGDITAYGGRLVGLNAEACSMGSIRFQGTAVIATLAAKGSGDIVVDDVVNTPEITESSMGRVRIKSR